MEGLILFFLLSLLIFSSNADNMVSEVITTQPHEEYNFPLPNSETAVLAAWTEQKNYFIRYRLLQRENEISADQCENCFIGSLWVPLLMITKQTISSMFMPHFNIPSYHQSMASRNLSVLSNVQMKWQVFPLPLANPPERVTIAGKDNTLSLPENEEVWIAYKLLQAHFQVDFNLKVNNYNFPTCSNAVTKNDWSLTRVLRNKIDNGNTVCPVEKDYGLTGRKLLLYSDRSIRYQIFTVPLQSEREQKPRHKDDPLGTHGDGQKPYQPNNDDAHRAWNPEDKDNSGSGDYSGGDQQPRNRDHSQGTQRDGHKPYRPINDGGRLNPKDRRRPNQEFGPNRDDLPQRTPTNRRGPNQDFGPNRDDLPQRTPTSSSTPRKDKTTSTTPVDDEPGQEVTVSPSYTPDIAADHGTIGRTIPSDEPGQKEVTLGTKPNKEGGKGLDTTKIVLILVITLLVVIAFLLCFKLVLKRCKHSQSQGTAPDTKVIIDNYSGTVELPSSTRPNSTHESENSIYGAVSGTHSAVTRQNSSHDSENSVYGVIRP